MGRRLEKTIRDADKAKEEFEAEVKAYRDFVARYQQERDKRKRIVMSNMLLYLLYSNQHGMKPSHALTEALDHSLAMEKEAKRAMYPVPLHQDIAEILTSSTHTVGRGRTTNWQMQTGTYYSQFDGKGRDWFDEWTAGEILASYVSFGAHRFGVGSATQRILELLEESLRSLRSSGTSGREDKLHLICLVRKMRALSERNRESRMLRMPCCSTAVTLPGACRESREDRCVGEHFSVHSAQRTVIF